MRSHRLVALLPLALSLGCEDPDPSVLKITAPVSGAMVDTAGDDDKTLDVAFSASYFRLKPPGQCHLHVQCGYIQLNIDDDACNDAGLGWNNVGPQPTPPPPMLPSPASPLKAKLARCPMVAGEHTIKLTLKNDDGTDVPATGGNLPVASVKVTVKPKAAPTPTIKITAPAPGATVMLDATGGADVAFAVANFTLKSVGECGTDRACGHVAVRIDGNDCNGAGKIYNSEATASPARASFGPCKMAAGMHVVELALHDDTHSDVPGGSRTAATVVVNVP